MSRMSGPARKEWYEFLIRRDGERCFIGGEPGTFDSLVLDHWNGNDSDNKPLNLHLLCRQMNSVKNPRGKAIMRKSRSESELLSSMWVRRVENDERVKVLIRRAQSLEVIRNLEFEPNFRHIVFYCIVHVRVLDLDKVVINVAELVGCSVNSAKRYMNRMTCEAGLYQLKECQETGKKLISLKPKWESFRKRNEENALRSKQVKNWKENEDIQTQNGNIIKPEFMKGKAYGTL